MGKKNGELEFIELGRPKTKKRSGRVLIVVLAVCLLGIGSAGGVRQVFSMRQKDTFLRNKQNLENYPEELLELLELNEETLDFVENYVNREDYQNQPIELTEEDLSGEVPLLMQWDKRWGYDAYSDQMIGLAGCGPVCMTMAYLHFTGDTSMNPRRMALFAYEGGYYTPEGTSWSFWTDGARQLGLSGENLSLDEDVMKSVLDKGGLIICSMSPGDFTTGGHFILIRGYDESGFFVNDPNRRSNSQKQWDFETLRGQMKNLWGIFG